MRSLIGKVSGSGHQDTQRQHGRGSHGSSQNQVGGKDNL